MKITAAGLADYSFSRATLKPQRHDLTGPNDCIAEAHAVVTVMIPAIPHFARFLLDAFRSIGLACCSYYLLQ